MFFVWHRFVITIFVHLFWSTCIGNGVKDFIFASLFLIAWVCFSFGLSIRYFLKSHGIVWKWISFDIFDMNLTSFILCFGWICFQYFISLWPYSIVSVDTFGDFTIICYTGINIAMFCKSKVFKFYRIFVRFETELPSFFQEFIFVE